MIKEKIDWKKRSEWNQTYKAIFCMAKLPENFIVHQCNYQDWKMIVCLAENNRPLYRWLFYQEEWIIAEKFVIGDEN
ncbi:hypothetical protein K2V03_002127 [Listeria innocua]|nr:hypothetical protein [Listeria innocua]EIU0523717.1 hypothetical protein [Listeria innocua]